MRISALVKPYAPRPKLLLGVQVRRHWTETRTGQDLGQANELLRVGGMTSESESLGEDSHN
jgi:hypothetical protein